ncbi:M14 family metallopeptidase [Ramlibacter alkalitolerans]|uniref:M14 family metallopeptidase n=1 Tax=Ramlibacter alkalitolerans TaxID=2039631 RepID=A0ABS1JI14_9BURK|nr:M14 family metallopeptidase [Ramlibacter alkalitolerans]MBL0423865.1 M14 family metallopeptidase [Ramlibacter alkalitolerans]
MKDAFANSYAEARQKFLAAAAQAGLPVEAKLHPEPGLHGEPLAMDVARDGHPDAARLLILTSACHGVEGFCGSGVQVAALRDAELRRRAAEAGVALLYVHALNPYGFSHVGRTTHENVDLNRNFHDFAQPLPVNEPYRELHEILVPATWPPGPDNQRAIGQYVAERGVAYYQAVMSRGQYEYPDGLFYGGVAPCWSNLALREVLRTHGRRAGRIAWIDIHTGLGPSGVGERILAARDDEACKARAGAWWSGGGRTPVTSIYDGSSTSAFLTGLMFGAAYDECPQAEYTGIALEYGTVPVLETFQALRAEQWLRRHPEASQAQKDAIRRQVFEAFYTDTDAWREQVVAQAREALLQAVEGLGA